MRNILCVFAVVVVAPLVGVAQDFAVTHLFGGGWPTACAINRFGLIAGSVSEGGLGMSRACLWRTQVAIDFGQCSAESTLALDINDAGLVLGNGFLWDAGTFARPVSGIALNSAGNTVGFEFSPGGVPYAFEWIRGSKTVLPTLGGSRSGALGLNDEGVCVGWSTDASELVSRACAWKNGEPSALDDSSSESLATSVSIHCVIAGRYSNGVENVPAKWVRENGRWARTSLSLLEGDSSGQALAVNADGDIVGSSGAHAVLWRGNNVIDLNAFLPHDAGQLNYWAADINDEGQIIVNFRDSSRILGAFLLTPVECRHFATGDLNCDGAIDNADIDAFVLALTQPSVWLVMYRQCNYFCVCDTNRDGEFNNSDIDSFVSIVLRE